jgi:hypothetical protein
LRREASFQRNPEKSQPHRTHLLGDVSVRSQKLCPTYNRGNEQLSTLSYHLLHTINYTWISHRKERSEIRFSVGGRESQTIIYFWPSCRHPPFKRYSNQVVEEIKRGYMHGNRTNLIDRPSDAVRALAVEYLVLGRRTLAAQLLFRCFLDQIVIRAKHMEDLPLSLASIAGIVPPLLDYCFRFSVVYVHGDQVLLFLFPTQAASRRRRLLLLAVS